MSDQTMPDVQVPESRTVQPKRTRISVVWIIPILAVLAGGWVAVTRILSEGPRITITLATAEGLEAGKTKVRYNGVNVGDVTSIRLTDDDEQVVLTVQMAPESDKMLVADTKFWVVSPRISGANVTGLSTLLSGAYIGMQMGTSTEKKRAFVGLVTPPVVAAGTPGRFFILTTPDLGSIDTGTPIYFRRLRAGQVASYQLNGDGRSLNVRVFVTAPYDQYVTANTRFWQASGIDVSLSAAGLKVDTQSALSILVGGIAFETPASGPVLPAAGPESVFGLYKTRTDAFSPPPQNPKTFVVIFRQSVRGLNVGAPVEFQGIPIGEVTEIGGQIDFNNMEFSAPVTIRVDATRLGTKYLGLKPGANMDEVGRRLLDSLVTRGGRAQLRSANLLTGSLYVAFELFKDVPPARIDWSQQPAQLPTIPGQLEATEARLNSIIRKLDELPLRQIGQDVHKTLADLDKAIVGLQGTRDHADQLLGNANRLIEPNSVLDEQLGSTLSEMRRAARSLRVLADYLGSHPEALLRGKAGEPDQENK